MYMAAEKEPGNVFVRQLLRDGIPNVLVLMKDTPVDVQRWVKDEHNKWHKGSAKNFLEAYGDIAPMEEAWEQHKKANNISVGTCPSTGASVLH